MTSDLHEDSAERMGMPSALSPVHTRTRDVLAAAIDVLPIIADDVAASAIEVLAVELVDVRERLTACEVMLSEALTRMHAQHCEIARLQIRLRQAADHVRELVAEQRMAS